MIDVLVLTTEGVLTRASIEQGVDALQKIVGGPLDVIDTPQGDMWVHDEGVFLCNPNPVASILVSAFNHLDSFYNQHVFGDVVITGGPDPTGETLSIEDDAVKTWESAVKILREDEEFDDYETLQEAASWFWAQKEFGRTPDVQRMAELASSLTSAKE